MTNEPFNQISLKLNWLSSGIITYSTDKRYYIANTLDFNYNKLSEILGQSVKMKLLEVGFYIKDIFYDNLAPGENSERQITNYRTSISQLRDLDDKPIYGNYNTSLEINFNQDTRVVNLGKGFIISDFVLPYYVSGIKINDDPPVNNSVLIMTGVLTLKYNNNYGTYYD